MDGGPLASDSLLELASDCRDILGADHVRPAAENDAVAGVTPRLVVAPGTASEVADILQRADAAGLAVIPRGGGTKLEWGNPPQRADVILDLTRLHHVGQHPWEDLTVTVEAGCPVAALQSTLAQHGQRLAIDPLWPDQATVGGILATNDSGALRLRFGGLRDLVIGVTLALPDGTLASSGGRVVKNVAGYDLPKLATGSLGTLGVITSATFRLHPLPRHARTLTIAMSDPEDAQQRMLAILDSQLVPAAVQIRLATARTPELDVLFEGTPAGIAAQEAALRDLIGREAVVDGKAWDARQSLWDRAGSADADIAIAKLSFLPADLATVAAAIDREAAAADLGWRAVVQATGLGWLRLEGRAELLAPVLASPRSALESSGGSLVVLRQPAGPTRVETWGAIGDALPLMQALKQQLDPRGTLNPGRFVGGI